MKLSLAAERHGEQLPINDMRLLKHGDYTRQLRPLLPSESFRPSPGRLWLMAAESGASELINEQF